MSAPFDGYLCLLTIDAGGAPVAAAFRQLKVSAPLFPPLTWLPIGIGFMAGLLVCLSSVVRLRGADLSLMSAMGSPSWDFTKSWASNLTIGGALLSIALGMTSVPEQTHYINKSGYMILNVVFALLAGLAPFLFNVFRKPATENDNQSGEQLEYVGYVICFLLASSVTICAVTAQLATLWLLLDEVAYTGRASTILIGFVESFIAALQVGIAFYAAQTIYWTVRSQSGARSNLVATAPDPTTALTQSVEGTFGRLPTWSPL